MSNPGFNINAPIPYVVLGVSVDCFYNFKKFYSGGFTWSFDIHESELYEVEREIMNFMARLTEKNLFGGVQVRLQCSKMGKIIESTVHIEYVRLVDGGWRIGDTY